MMDNNKKKIKFNIYIFFVIAASVFGLMMSLIIPVSQVPDEYTHFELMLRAYGAEKMYGEDLNEFFRPSGLDSFNSGDIRPVDGNAYMDNGMKSYSEGLFGYGFKPGITAVRFIPQAVGFFAGVLLRLPILICHQLGELTALIFYILICLIALKKMPFKKEVLMFIMLMPMAMQEAGSFSPDVTVNALSFLITAMIFDFKTREKKVGWKEMIIFALMTGVVLVAKEIYILVAFGIFIVPLDRFSLMIGKKFDLAQFIKKYKILFIVILAAIAVTLGILCRDFRYVKILYASVLQPGRSYLLFKNTLFGYKDFYLQTMVGSFGWLDSGVSYTFVTIFFMMLFYVNLFQSKKSIELQEDFTIGNRIYLVLLSGMMFVFIFISMVSWSFFLAGFNLDVGVAEFRAYLYQIDYMLGVQGRYFIPFLPMLCISLGRGNEAASTKRYTIVQACYYVLSIVLVLRILFIRYWG